MNRAEHLRLELFEDRVTPATLIVTSTADNLNAGTLRASLAAAAETPGTDVITFAPKLFGGTITLTSGELRLPDGVTIRGPRPDQLTIAGNYARVISVPENVTATIVGVKITDGFAASGGGISNKGNLTLEFVEVSNNTAWQEDYEIAPDRSSPGMGGGIYNAGTLTIRQSLIAGNNARAGGFLVEVPDPEPDFLDNTRTENRALNATGGGIYNDSGATLTLVNTTISGNTAEAGDDSPGIGAGIYSRGTVAIRFSTIADNQQGAGIASDSSGKSIQISNSIVAGNFGNVPASFTNSKSDVSGSFVSGGFNVIQTVTGATGFIASDQLGVDPRLDFLNNNGGPTRTHLIAADSPARNASDPTLTDAPRNDQRNAIRPESGRLDIGAVDLDATLRPAPVSPPIIAQRFALGADQGNAPVVGLFDEQGLTVGELQAFDSSFTGGVRVAMADLNRDGIADLIVGAGPGNAPLVRAFNGKDRTLLWETLAFEESFRGGVYVAAGDLTGDGVPEVVITPDQGGGPVVKILDANGGTLNAFFGIEDPNFRGGARAALGDINADNRFDLLVAAGFGGGPRLAIFNGVGSVFGTPPKLVDDFFLFEQSLRNGAYIAAGDVNGDSVGDIIAGGGPGGGPRVMSLDGYSIMRGLSVQESVRLNLFAGDVNQRGGVRVSGADVNGDGFTDILTAPGAGGDVQVYNGKTQEAISFGSLKLGGSGGVFVGSVTAFKSLDQEQPVDPPPTYDDYYGDFYDYSY